MNTSLVPGSAPRIYYGYWLIAGAFAAQFVAYGIFSYVQGAFITPMIEDLQWSRTEFTLSRSLSQVVMGLTGFVIGSYVDRYGARPLMLIGTTILVISLGLHAYVDTLWQWVVLNGAIATVGCALIGNLVVNVTMAKWFVEKRGQAVAWAAMGVSFGGVALLPAVTIGIDVLGWRETWLWLALGVAVVMYPVALIMRRTPEDHGWHPDGKSAAEVAGGQAERAALDYARSLTRRQALRTLTFYLLVVAFGMFTINIVVILLQTVPYLTDAGFSRTQAALAITVASVPAMLSKPFWGYFIDRLAPKPLASLSAAITGLALLLVVWAVQWGSLPWIYSAYCLLGLGWGGMMPLQEVIWGAVFGRRYLGAVRSAGLPFALLLGAAAPLAVSYYHDVAGSYDGALVAVAGLNLLAGVLLLLIREPSAVAATS
jgi:OFA family oxalate/formate antiporter-like MFS transporter